ncbi:MAG: hypothetical protein ACFFD2_11785 [Promethearchaeota archaeon]
MSGTSLWKKKELTNYQRKLKSELPPFYDFKQVRSVHQEIEAIILEYWEFLHPVVQDFITSWFLQWKNVKKKCEGLAIEKEQKISMLEKFKKRSTTKIQNLTNEINIKQSELNKSKQNIQHKEEQIQQLEEIDKENQFGISELRSELEKQLAELNLQLTEIQNRFEATQSQVMHAFENKVMIFESEVSSLKEQGTSQEERIQQLQSENQQIKSQNQELNIFEDKIAEIIDLVGSISFKEIEN